MIHRLQTLPAWQRTLFILAFAQLITSIGFSNIFPFLPFYLQTLKTTARFSVEIWVGLIFSVQAATMMIASPIWGSLSDRYGRKVMVERATFGGAILIGLMGFVRTAEELVLLRALQGVVTGVVSAITALAIADTPRERTGYTIGVLQISRWVGVAVGPLLGGAIADWIGYRPAFIVTTVLLVLAGVMVWRGVHETFTPSGNKQNNHQGFWQEWQHILAAPGVKPTYTIEFLNWLSRTIFMPVLPLFIQVLMPLSTHVSTFTGLVLGISSASATLGAVYLGRLGDRLGHRRILIPSIFAAAGLYLLQIFVRNGTQILLLQALTGVALGGLIPALGALLATYTQPGEEGAVYGLDNSIVSAARAIAPMMGAGISMWAGLRGTIAATGIILMGTAVLAMWQLPKTQSVSV